MGLSIKDKLRTVNKPGKKKISIEEMVKNGIEISIRFDLDLLLLKEDLDKALKTLEQREQFIILMEYYNNIPLQDLAEVLDLDFETIVHIKNNAFKKLRDQSIDLIDYIHTQ